MAHEFFNKVRDEGLQSNYHQAAAWSKYKTDLNVTKELLNDLPSALSKKILVPLGRKAFMPGQIVHTNEFLVSIGAGYFAKSTAHQASLYCDRRIQGCDEALKNLDAELALLSNRLSLPGQHDAFGSEERPEIVEHMTEEEDTQWRKQHREKERKYREQLAESRASRAEIQNESSLWARLDQLELEEELEDELLRLQDDASDTDDSEDIEEHTMIDNTIQVPPAVPSEKRRRSVIFAKDVPDNDVHQAPPPLELTFTHSNTTSASSSNIIRTGIANSLMDSSYSDAKANPASTNSMNTSTASKLSVNSSTSCKMSEFSRITSPGEIFPEYLANIRASTPVSILKVKENPNSEMEAVKEAFSSDEEEDEDVHVVHSGFVIADVKEVSGTRMEETNINQNPRRISKFKASRQNIK